MLLLEAWRPKCFPFGLFISPICWRLLSWHLMEIDGPNGLNISSSIVLRLVLFFATFIVEKDFAYSDCLDWTCSILFRGLGLFQWALLWSSCCAFGWLSLNGRSPHLSSELLLVLDVEEFRRMALPNAFFINGPTFTRICAWSLLMYPTCQMDLRWSHWGVVPWLGICGLVWTDSLGPWMVLVPFRHSSYFVILSRPLLFSSIQLMKTFVHLTRQWCCSFALSLVDLLLICPCYKVWGTSPSSMVKVH